MKKKIGEMKKNMKKVWMTAAMVMGITLTCANSELVVNAEELSVGEAMVQEMGAAEEGAENENASDKLPDNGDGTGEGGEKDPETDSDGEGNGDGVPYMGPDRNGEEEL